MIRRFKIKNFKRFMQETKIDLDAITVLIGANNSGKSTILQAFSFFQYCLEVTRKESNGRIDLVNKTIGPEEFGALPVASPTDLWPNGKPKAAIVLTAEFSIDATIGFEIKLSYNRFSITPKPTGDYRTLIQDIKVRYVPIHTGLILREEFRMAPALADSLRKLEHGTVIRNLLWDLKKNNTSRWRRLLEVVGRIYPECDLDVLFNEKIDRFINSEYSDQALTRKLDLVVSGTGFQQVLQILTGILSNGSTLVLLDEPDSHLHARLQVEMLTVFEDLSRTEGIQFLLATHSSHLVASAPAGSLRVLMEGKAHRFATEPDQVDLLETLGAFDRMEIVPLLRTKAVVFVENRDDRNFLEMFAKKLWGEVKTRKVWDKVSFLFTYQDPMGADVKRLARQVKDLLNSPDLKGLGGGKQAKFLIIGDRDYRRSEVATAARKDLLKKAKSNDFNLELDCVIWSRNEIENYFIDVDSIARAIRAGLGDEAQAETIRNEAEGWIRDLLDKQKETVRNRIAEKMQHEDYQLRTQLQKTIQLADKVLDEEWDGGEPLCDAKLLLKGIRRKLQDSQIQLRSTLSESSILAEMHEVPLDVVKALKKIQFLSGSGRKTKFRKKKNVKKIPRKRG